MKKKVWTIGQTILWSAAYMAKQGLEQARILSEWLMAWHLGKERTDLYIGWNEVLSESQLSGYGLLLRRLVQGEPLAYILGYQPFLTLKIKVTPDVLIPRPETECLVEWVVSDCRERGLLRDSPLKILDLCCGSGAIGVAIARFLPEAEITATDIHCEAVRLTKENALLADVADRVSVTCGDLFDPVIEQLEDFDIIVSNPPYVSESNQSLLGPEVSRYEPKVALSGGSDGLDFYRRIKAMIGHLNKTVIYLETGHDQKEALDALFKGCGSIQWKKDHQDIWRMMKVVVK